MHLICKFILFKVVLFVTRKICSFSIQKKPHGIKITVFNADGRNVDRHVFNYQHFSKYSISMFRKVFEGRQGIDHLGDGGLWNDGDGWGLVNKWSSSLCLLSALIQWLSFFCSKKRNNELRIQPEISDRNKVPDPLDRHPTSGFSSDLK